MKQTFLLSLFLFFAHISVFSQSYTIKGRVTGSTSQPIEKAQVKILNGKYAEYTDETGNFAFYNIPEGSYLITIEKTNFARKSLKIKVDRETTRLEIVLQPSIEQLDEVLITAEKREQLLQNVPVSITALTKEQIEENQIWNTKDLTAVIPNLYSSDPGDKRNLTSVRGIVSSSYEPAVATYIDGVSQFNLDTYIAQLYNIERIEVLRGPQGTLYGRNAMGGVVNIITEKPDQTTSGFAEATTGSYGFQRYVAGIETPLINQKLFFGATGLYEEKDGYYTNLYDNTHYDKQHSISGNYYLNYFLNSEWEILLNFKHFSNRNNGAFPLAADIETALNNPYTLNQDQKTKMIDNSINTSLSLEYKGKNYNFSSQTAYQFNHRYYDKGIDADFSPLDAISIYNNYGNNWNTTSVVTQELKFSSPATKDNKMEWTAGTFLFYKDSPVKQATVFGEDADLLGIEDKNFSLINSSKIIGKGAAIYSQGIYGFSEKLNLTAGIRYDYESSKQSILGEYRRNEEVNPSFEFQADSTASANFHAFSPKIGFEYSFSEDHMSYIMYSRGFRAGGLSPLTTDPSQPPLYKFKPEFSNNFEIGAKNSFLNKRIVVNTSIFLVNVQDVQVPTLILPDAVTITKNTGKLTSYGGELELQAIVTTRLKMEYNLGFTHATYNSLLLSTQETQVNLKGNHQIFTPEKSSRLALNYRPKLKNSKFDLSTGLEWSYIGKQYFDFANTLKQEPYHLFSAQVCLKYQNLSLRLWAKNLTDERYLSYGYDFGAVRLGNPREIGITLKLEL